MPAPQRQIVMRDSRPSLPRHIKLRHDDSRGRWLVLAPERVFDPDATAVSILKLVNGQRTVEEIAILLAQEYDAPIETIIDDAVGMLQDLADKCVVTISPEHSP
jgi:pyrroloquinoline quinone biosynthesis protein D